MGIESKTIQIYQKYKYITLGMAGGSKSFTTSPKDSSFLHILSTINPFSFPAAIISKKTNNKYGTNG